MKFPKGLELGVNVFHEKWGIWPNTLFLGQDFFDAPVPDSISITGKTLFLGQDFFDAPVPDSIHITGKIDFPDGKPEFVSVTLDIVRVRRTDKFWEIALI